MGVFESRALGLVSPDGLQFGSVDEINDNFPIAEKSKLKSAALLALPLHTPGKLVRSLTSWRRTPRQTQQVEKKIIANAAGVAFYTLADAHTHKIRI